MQSRDQDQKSLCIEDTTMTIEFLRARLLSERSVSKSAKQRADELAEMVAELEEQLRIVSLQRKKAEKATADVLAILETQGISDISDSFYSSSDEEMTPRGQKARDGDSKKAEGSVNSRERESELERFTGSDLDPSPVLGRRLSWKGRKDPCHSVEKSKASPSRRRGSFASVSSSSKHRMGKSCRQIKRREHRSEATELGDDSSLKDGSQKNGGESEMGAEISRADSGLQEDRASSEAVDSGLLGDEFGAKTEMERALEHQAELIGQYKDMEKEQREWEEKYRENNSSTAESCDPGNHSDITEEREEVKSRSTYSHPVVTTLPQHPKTEIKHHSTSNSSSESHVSSGFLETSRGDQTACPQVQEEPTSTPRHDLPKQKLTSLVSDGPKKQESTEKISAQRSEASGKQIESYAVVPHQTSDRVGNLLDTLQRAKSLLQKEITRVPASGFRCAVKAIEPAYRGYPVPTGKLDIPGGCPGLFRLPTDFPSEAARGNNFAFWSSSSGTGSRLSSTGYFTESRALVTSDDRFGSGRYTESMPSSPIDDRFLTNQFMNSAARTVPSNPRLDPHLNSAIPTTHTSYPMYPSYPDLVPRLSSNGGYFPRLDQNTESSSRPADNFLFHANGPNMMYR